jgi:ABC-type oligopeptide transport system ATPase subunit
VTPANSPLLVVANLSKEFPIRGTKKVVHACHDVSLEVHTGQTIGVIGESGSGKTTLGRCIVRLIEPTRGSITVEGTEITEVARSKLRPLRRTMQIVFQEPLESFNPALKMASQIALPLKVLSGLSSEECRKEVSLLLRQVGLPESIAAALPGSLPAGVLQKCSIARAISTNPRLLVLDEPTSRSDHKWWGTAHRAIPTPKPCWLRCCARIPASVSSAPGPVRRWPARFRARSICPLAATWRHAASTARVAARPNASS